HGSVEEHRRLSTLEIRCLVDVLHGVFRGCSISDLAIRAARCRQILARGVPDEILEALILLARIACLRSSGWVEVSALVKLEPQIIGTRTQTTRHSENLPANAGIHVARPDQTGHTPERREQTKSCKQPEQTVSHHRLPFGTNQNIKAIGRFG